MKPRFNTTITVVTLLLAAVAAGAANSPVTIAERYITTFEPQANIDSVAVAPASHKQPALLFATAKDKDVVKVFDAASGRELREIGGSGSSAGQYLRPNGIAVIDDLLLVVERDNRRVSIRSVPDDRVLAVFGEEQLQKPYGLWTQALGGDRYRLFVTDNYETDLGGVPAPEALGERVKSWRLAVTRDADGRPVSISQEFEKSFGETAKPGALRVVESLFGDARHGRLLIAEEDETPDAGLVIKVYNLDGQYTGRQMGKGIFKAQAEGIALYACGDGSGYWLSTDQADERTIYHLFDRKSLRHSGAFTGKTTANTDGVWLAQSGVPGFEAGAFFAVHDDQAVSAFDWAEILATLGLDRCRS